MFVEIEVLKSNSFYHLSFIKHKFLVLLLLLISVSQITQVFTAYVIKNADYISLLNNSEETEEKETEKEESSKEVFHHFAVFTTLPSINSFYITAFKSLSALFIGLYHSLPETPPPNWL